MNSYVKSYMSNTQHIFVLIQREVLVDMLLHLVLQPLIFALLPLRQVKYCKYVDNEDSKDDQNDHDGHVSGWLHKVA